MKEQDERAGGKMVSFWKRRLSFLGECQKKHLESQGADIMICYVIYHLVLENGWTQLCVLSDWALYPKLEFLFR